jgi:hypothetical protein
MIVLLSSNSRVVSTLLQPNYICPPDHAHFPHTNVGARVPHSQLPVPPRTESCVLENFPEHPSAFSYQILPCLVYLFDTFFQGQWFVMGIHLNIQ